jgi:hypothetical protein
MRPWAKRMRRGGPGRAPAWHWVPIPGDLWALAVPGGHVRVALEADGAYAVAGFTKALGHIDLGHLDDLEAARVRAETWATSQNAEHLHRHDAADRWRLEPASDDQRACCVDRGLRSPWPARRGMRRT